jgi:preprotein translocase subunit YajC
MWCAVAGLVLCASGLAADEVRGKIKAVDADKHTITVTVGDRDQEFTLTDDTKLLGPSGKDVKNGLNSPRLTAGAEVTVSTEKKGGQDVCTKVQLRGQKVQLAGGVQGKVKKVDADQATVTVTVADRDQEFKVTDQTKLLGPSGKDLKDGLNSSRLAEGAEVTVVCEKKDGKDVCTRIQLKGQKKNR